MEHSFHNDRSKHPDIDNTNYKRIKSAYHITQKHTDDETILSIVNCNTMLGFGMKDSDILFSKDERTGYIIVNSKTLSYFDSDLTIAAVIMHEFAHYRHRDFRSRSIRTIAYLFMCAVHPYLLPIVLILESCIRQGTEYAADHYAAKIISSQSIIQGLMSVNKYHSDIAFEGKKVSRIHSYIRQIFFKTHPHLKSRTWLLEKYG